MAIFKRLLIGITIVVLIFCILLFLQYGFVDERLSGVFISDQNGTIEELSKNEKIDEEKIKIFKQMYGKLTIEFKNHKIKWAIPSQKILNFPQKGDVFSAKEETIEKIFISKSNQKEALVYLLPKPIWDFKNFEIMVVQFEPDGFWLISNNSFGTKIKEKFYKK